MKIKIIAILVLVSLLIGAIVACIAVDDQVNDSGRLPIYWDWNVSYNNLKTFNSYQEIEDYLASQDEMSGYSYSYYYSNLTKTVSYYDPGFRDAEGTGNTADSSSGGSSDHSSTNVQVEGVDEGDIVKNDGKYAYIVSQNRSKVFIVDVYPPEKAKIASIIEFEWTVKEIYVNDDKLVVLGINGPNYGYYRYYWTPYSSNPRETYIRVFDIEDRKDPELSRKVQLDGYFVTSRIIGDYLYVIVTQPTNQIENEMDLPVPASRVYYTDDYDYYYTFTNIISVNVQDDNEEPNNEVILMGTSTHIYVSVNNIYLTYLTRMSWVEKMERRIEEVIIPVMPDEVANDINAIKSSDLSRMEKLKEIDEVVGEYSESLTDEENEELAELYQTKENEFEENIQRDIEKTTIHRIFIKGGNIKYMASGGVPGYVLNRFSMDEYQRHFRIATTTGHVSRMGDSGVCNHVFVLDLELKIVGGVRNIGPGERIYSARFMKDRGYLVTFKKVDPFFVLDLSDPTNPFVLGKLKIPGYSNYLHPYDENHVIGIGKDTVPAKDGDFAWYQGVKLSLFDVTDVNNPKELSKYIIGDRGTHSLALDDPHAFLFSRDKNLLVIPIVLAEIDKAKYPGGCPPQTSGVYTWCGAYVFEISPKNGFKLRGGISHAENIDPSSFSWYYDSPYKVKRSFYIKDVLYTISGRMIKANDMASLSEINSLKLSD